MAMEARTAAVPLCRTVYGDVGDLCVPNMLWKFGRLNHVAIATLDLKKSTALFRDVLRADVSEQTVLDFFLRLDQHKWTKLVQNHQKS